MKAETRKTWPSCSREQHITNRVSSSSLCKIFFHRGRIFKNPRYKSQVEFLARHIRPRNPKALIEVFEAATEKPHSYLFLDLTQVSGALTLSKQLVWQAHCDLSTGKAMTKRYTTKRHSKKHRSRKRRTRVYAAKDSTASTSTPHTAI